MILGEVIGSEVFVEVFENILVDCVLIDVLGLVVNLNVGMFLYGVFGNGKFMIVSCLICCFG